MVHSYGLAASQLTRIRNKGIPLTAVVDMVAASGGYLMAAVANRVLAAPFALVGSIGVVAQIPNVHRLLKKNDIDVEVLTAGKYKRTMTVLGENTDEAREKFVAELEDVHALFQEFVADNRPGLDLDTVATGEAWYGKRALALGLVDELATSDEYLMSLCEEHDVYSVEWVEHKKPIDRLLGKVNTLLDQASSTLDMWRK
jgi:serine protease SohB